MYVSPQYQVQNFRSQQSGQRSPVTSLSQARQLVGTQVKINRGPDSVEGRLLALNGDVLVVDSNNTIIYVNGRHVKSITEGTSQGGGGKSGKGGRSGKGSQGGRSGLRRSGLTPTFIAASSFNTVLVHLQQQFVQINRGGPEMLEGFLGETSTDFILLVVGRELVRIPLYHIKTVNVSDKNQNKNNNNSSGQSNQSGDNRNRSGGGSRNRSGGGSRNRSGGGNRNRSGGRSRNRSGGGRNRNRNRNRR